MLLHLDKQFSPYKGERIEYELFRFAGGEPHIKILTKIDASTPVMITSRIKDFRDIGDLLTAVDALKNMGINNISLTIPYFPGARQDRINATGEALTIKVYTDLINSLQLNKVIIFDPHSDVTPALLNNCHMINNHEFVKKITQKLSSNLKLISPDGGALKKIYKLASYLKHYDVVECSKTRDTTTGQLSGFRVYTKDLNQQDCVIVDDICDGGGTFIGLAKELKKKNAGKLYLIVSHGIFSKGLDELKKQFEHIYTTDSFKTNEPDDQLTEINLSTIL
ncbi:MAG: ribose-phosphate diphosphokinase [Flavipsychrobacter sp.]